MNNEKDNIMKTIATFLFASAVVLGFTFTAKTADFAASPAGSRC
jgi:hypothetical protein